MSNSWLVRLALWAQCPGDDFDKPWAHWMIDGAPDWIYNIGWTYGVEKPITEICCLMRGHRVINDHCQKPEHRFCWICHRLQPNAVVNGRED